MFSRQFFKGGGGGQLSRLRDCFPEHEVLLKRVYSLKKEFAPLRVDSIDKGGKTINASYLPQAESVPVHDEKRRKLCRVFGQRPNVAMASTAC